VEHCANKVFIISLDGATFDVLTPLANQGYLPNLARLVQSGLAAELESVIPPVTAPAWTSFMTGKNPNKHGIFDFTRFDPTDCKWKINNSAHIRSKTIWQILSEQKKRVIVLNLPYTYPTYPVNGAMVAGWDAPSSASFTYPEALRDEVFKAVPDYGSALDLSLWNYLPTDSQADFDKFIDKLRHSFEQSARLASHFLATQPWDVFMVHFQQTDWIQHKLWGYIERACHDGNDHSERIEKVRKCYQTFDKYIGQLLGETAPLNPIQIILSDHGFGGNFGTICPNHVLREMGYYHLQESSQSVLSNSLKRSRHGRNIIQVLKDAKNIVRGRQALKQYKSWADMTADTVPQEKSFIDWSRTKAAFVNGSEVGFIYVNGRDRGPFGCVEPGAELETVTDSIITQFRALLDPKTVKRLLARVCRGAEIYSPAVTDVLLPDVVLVPTEGYVVGAGLYEPFVRANGALGDHRPNGVLVLNGPGLHHSCDGFCPRLIDLAPTILHALRLAVPNDMDGRVLEEVFRDPLPVEIEAAEDYQTAGAHDYSTVETELVTQRLRALGYVE
jgi:predicted AlkP superfamily phosphohydrolase/phosphomutase